jgi:FkbM family methyltransferase
MSNLKIFNIKKSAIKKWFPFRQLLDLRDKRIYKKKYSLLKHKFSIQSINDNELILNYREHTASAKLSFRPFPFSDLSVLFQVFSMQCYAPLLPYLKEYFSPDATMRIIDAGANVGYATIFFYLHFPKSHIIAIEPESKNVEQFEKNLRLNIFSGQVTILESALWPRPAYLRITRDFRDNREAAFTVEEIENNEKLEGITFQTILKNQNWNLIDLFKIDIEGSERFLFHDREIADELLRKTKFLAIEIHDEYKIRGTIYAALKRNNFMTFEYGDLTFGINQDLVGDARKVI